MTLKQPSSVVAAIIPWNVPLIMFAMKVGAAITAKNAIIIKSSEKAPLTSTLTRLQSFKMGSLIKQAQFPPGLINIISRHGHVTGKLLAKHLKICKIAFTGSIATRKKIMQMAAASNLKNVTLELSRKSPAIIFADADLNMTAKATEFSIHQNSGQHYQANSRIFVEESILDKYIKKVTRLMQTSVLAYSKKRILNRELIIKGKATKVNGKEAKIFKKEIFSPVLLVNTFKTEKDVITRANNSEYRLFYIAFLYIQGSSH
ncbi:ALDH-like protein [Zopfia rhizophila CBS 207.26]|uniref:aldehyde dehydrogenase (NAD(+)) n=1 Tax=Zopfia rhizophila CBS 207.26 TaxID=1314779 RepID=A0A6A6D9E4_9PEZI|nr:ALDH-like protein [Zopfia rhizophila CBS 207.26]